MDQLSITSAVAAPARRGRSARWIPCALLVALVFASFVLGRGPVTESHAADIGVTGSLAPDIFIDASACTAAAVDIGELVPGTDGWKTAQDQGGQACSIDFGTTNHEGGTTLSMLEDPAAAAGPALKCVVADCAGASIDDFESATAEPSVGTAAFGTQLLASAGAATPIWNFSPGVYGLQDAAAAACSTPSIGTGTCAFTWGATAAATTRSGAYQARVNLVVLAN